ncbi:MAG: MarR family transcriptional regulator [Alphaproteobacteria bacterium]|jgi:DNA-binding MarR family transcriptional regulator|uniref:MarR family winged helix-turn-helix transcriptional regulator n=1 Tax=Ciceribacter selenitireducens TaxID=448181 RepID=UPI00048CC5E0|nr:MarR family transcriptional regulator [Ciceribacter selenitireducens]MBA3043180.1 MarR family transcriptional regulator [Rhizobiaceae bacterium]MBC7151508.1 MarR family transcriptional regulator [Rhizobium sp.]MBU3959266.1 MarR family transcriptional regulator [Alphaproteobacteria bacterium]PPJ45572.1 MarR family transcriptional regulator [Rhizobium sp. KAs_5_22]MBU4049204.1 MarR family transcriptional regulator [Alphaproteobacteria bacterium]
MLEIYEMPGHLVRRLNQAAVSVFMDETGKKGFDLTPVQYAALSAIEAKPGLDQATLASRIAYDRVTIGGVVDRLVQKELVRRETNPSDRRARNLFVTEKGTQALAEIRPIVKDVQSILLEGLDADERRQFISLLQKACEAVNDRSRAPLRVT